MIWEFELPVKIVFGSGKRKELEKYIEEIQGKSGVLVCSRSFEKNGTAQKFTAHSGGRTKPDNKKRKRLRRSASENESGFCRCARRRVPYGLLQGGMRDRKGR